MTTPIPSTSSHPRPNFWFKEFKTKARLCCAFCLPFGVTSPADCLDKSVIDSLTREAQSPLPTLEDSEEEMVNTREEEARAFAEALRQVPRIDFFKWSHQRTQQQQQASLKWEPRVLIEHNIPLNHFIKHERKMFSSLIGHWRDSGFIQRLAHRAEDRYSGLLRENPSLPEDKINYTIGEWETVKLQILRICSYEAFEGWDHHREHEFQLVKGERKYLSSALDKDYSEGPKHIPSVWDEEPASASEMQQYRRAYGKKKAELSADHEMKLTLDVTPLESHLRYDRYDDPQPWVPSSDYVPASPEVIIDDVARVHPGIPEWAISEWDCATDISYNSSLHGEVCPEAPTASLPNAPKRKRSPSEVEPAKRQRRHTQPQRLQKCYNCKQITLPFHDDIDPLTDYCHICEAELPPAVEDSQVAALTGPGIGSTINRPARLLTPDGKE